LFIVLSVRSRDWKSSIYFVSREANYCALGQCRYSEPFSLAIVNYVSAYAPYIVISDVGGVYPHQLS